MIYLMNKTTKYALNGAVWLGIGNAAINAIKQIIEIDQNPDKKFDWQDLMKSAGKGALVGGSLGLALGAITDYQNSVEKPINTDLFLLGLVSNIRLDKEDKPYKRLDVKANFLSELLKYRFEYQLNDNPIRLGSTEKETALIDKFDIDICLPFKSASFHSTEEMYFTVLDFLKEYTGTNSIVEVREQKKSIGVIFGLHDEMHKIDIVPCKLTNSNKNSTSGYLYINGSINGKPSSYTKTDIYALKSIKLSDTQKKIVIILKNWKSKNELPLSSHLLEHLVLDAYSYNTIPKGLTEKIIMVLDHIACNLDIAVIRSIENTNNILTNIPNWDKNKIIKACNKAIEEYSYQPNSILEVLG